MTGKMIKVILSLQKRKIVAADQNFLSFNSALSPFIWAHLHQLPIPSSTLILMHTDHQGVGTHENCERGSQISIAAKGLYMDEPRLWLRNSNKHTPHLFYFSLHFLCFTIIFILFTDMIKNWNCIYG